MTLASTEILQQPMAPVGLMARDMPFDQIPMIDLGPLLDDDLAARRTVAIAIRDAAIHVGFFYVTNHGVPETLIADTFRCGADFFAQPIAEKMKIYVRDMGFDLGGYTPLKEEDTSEGGHGDLHECLDIVYGVPSDTTSGSRKLPWPENLPLFGETLEAYERAVFALGRRLYGAFALALDLPEDHFEAMLVDPMRGLRINYYPSQDESVTEDQIGIGAHSDYECLTILAQDQAPALQVRNSAGEWIAAPPIPGTFVVNIGDLMERWTNDLFSATVHRAINLTGRERYSIPFFLGVDAHTVIETLPGCVSPDNPRKYDPVLAGPYVQERIASTYSSVQP